MKKFLFATTALVGLYTASALADAPTVTVGGQLNFEAGARSQKNAFKNANVGGVAASSDLSATGNNPNTGGLNKPVTYNQKNFKFNNQTRVYVKAEGKSDAGFIYGGVVNLKTTANTTGNAVPQKTDNTYIYFESELGRLELGSNYSAAKALKVDSNNLSRASGGAGGGNWSNYVTPFNNLVGDALNYSTYPAMFWTSADHISDFGLAQSGAIEQSRKIAYFSPRYAGFQFGLSYAADSDNVGDIGNFDLVSYSNGALNDKGVRTVKNLFSGGVNYTQQFDQVTLALSATGEAGSSNTHNLRDINWDKTASGKKHPLKGYALGANLTYANFTIGGSYGAANKKFLANDLLANSCMLGKVANCGNGLSNNHPHYWTAGASYVQGPFGASLSYMQSNVQRNKYTNWSLGADYQLAAGMMPYVEANWFSLKASNNTPRATVGLPTSLNLRNRGSVYIVGTQFSF